MPFAGPQDDRRIFVSDIKWSYISDEDKERAAEEIMNGLGLSNFVLFEGLWFYIWLLHRARKNLSEDRRQELLKMANEADQEAMA